MKLKLLLFALLLSGVLYAQDTINYLIITESHAYRADQSYVELTNLGDKPLQMAEFKLGKIGPYEEPFNSTLEYRFPERILQPGESFVIARFMDFTEKMYPTDPDNYTERVTPIEYWEFADIQMHAAEANSIPGIDSVSADYKIMDVWNGREGWYIEQHLSNGDSVLIDQVGGVFDNTNDRNFDKAYDVAGVLNATGNSILVRKFSVKQGNLDFANARGVGEGDSEWIVIPLPDGGNRTTWRTLSWTAGNHGDYKLNENMLQSSTVDVDWATQTITVPWGTRNLDDFVREFEKKPGLAWFYHFSESREDSAYVSARTGDKITFYACGSKVTTETFDIVLAPPTNDANVVLPKYKAMANGFFSAGGLKSGRGELFLVTDGAAGMDSITNSLFGIPHATRVDTLFKYLEKASNANWEIVWVDGVVRTDLKNGDVLKVTAENGSHKEYFIKINSYKPSKNANLSAITWPDMPKYLYDLFGWIGDTIPGFTSTVYNYNLQVPLGVDGIPALIAKTEHLNSKVDVQRATSLSGTSEQKTITFTVTAEDGKNVKVYNVTLEKEKNPNDIQPFFAEPFISEVVFQDQWANGFVEICNPGNQILDLSEYLITFSYASSPADAIQNFSGDGDWNDRYKKYVPGYKWVSKESWSVSPAILETDLNVNSIVYPGDVFVMGSIKQSWAKGYPWFASEACDVIFNEQYNPWNEPTGGNAASEWWEGNLYLFKIMNDSIKLGLKPANDPNDFQLMDVFGMGDGSKWEVGGYNIDQTSTFIRKPQYYQGKKNYKESFGTNAEDTEWFYYDRAYWNSVGVWWSDDIMNDGKDLGKHYMFPVTSYMSTVTSVVYKVSEGYSMKEEIRGMTPGTTVGTFLSNLNKANEKQSLTVMSGDAQLGTDDLLSMDDVLVVLSADSTNTSQYILEVSEEGLSSNAVLTSTLYEVVIENEPKSASATAEDGSAYITGFEYGTQLRTVLNNVNVPMGANLNIIDGEGAYVPLTRLNFDTAYVSVTVNANTYFEVVAENGVTRIVYQLQPRSSQNDAFILSDVYTVFQGENLVNFVPRGTNVQTFLANIVPSLGATFKLVDKMGFERTEGTVRVDDKVVVTSPNGLVTRAYHLAMLRTQYIIEPAYLAYVLSNVYAVDQVDYTITGPTATTLLSDFYARITASMGATAVVVDAGGNEKTTGDLDDGDMLRVTSADGKIVVMYELKLDLTSVDITGVSQIEIYPNPTSGKLNIRGAEQGNRIQVYNSNGTIVRDILAQRNIENLSINNQPAGIYMVIVSNNGQLLGNYKIVKK
jgi:hypothetical protein